MKKRKFTFESEGINVDYISFKILNLTNNYEIKKIRDAFCQSYGYESSIVYEETEQKIKEIHSYSTEKRIFFKHWKKPSWEGCIICFPGLTGKHFYNQIKREGIPWKIFRVKRDRIQLSRIDIVYQQPWTAQIIYDLEKIEDYFSKQLRRNRVGKIDKHDHGEVLTLGTREGVNFHRIYPNQAGLRFELELKKFSKTAKITKAVQDYLLESNYVELEDKLVKHFVRQFARRLDLTLIQTHWLLKKIRIIFPNHGTSTDKNFFSTYLRQSNHDFEDAFQQMKRKNPESTDQWYFSNDEAFFTLLQLHAFIAQLDNDSTSKALKANDIFEDLANTVNYANIEFPLIDFLKFIEIKQVTHHIRKKYGTFLKVLPFATHILQEFDDETFVSLVQIPSTSIKKAKQRLLVSLTMDTNILRYRYPFAHSDYFIRSHNKYQMDVKLMIIQIFNKPSSYKEIPIDVFLKRFKTYPAQVRKTIKSYLLESLMELKKKKFIKPYFILKKKNTQQERLTKLDLQHLAHTHIIGIQENIQFI